VFPLYFHAVGGMLANISPAGPGQPPTVPDLSAMMDAYRYMLLFYLLEIALLAQVALGMTRRALGMQQGPVFVFFSVGKTYWQLVGAYLIMVVLQIVVVFVAEFAAVIVGGVLALIGAGALSGAQPGTSVAGMVLGALVAVVLVVSVLLAVLYIMSRLTFLLTPAIVAENRFALFRSWELTGGSFWRMFVIGLAIFGPLMIVLAIFYSFLLSSMLPTLAGLQHNPGTANDPQVVMQAMNTVMTAFFNMMRQYWYALAAGSLIVSALTYGLMLGAAASAYRSQTEEASAPAAFS
jgi:hypothetical protein